MAIQRWNDSTLKDLYLISKDGYFYTVGPKNGSKIYQPGTRGKVFSDASISMTTNTPLFTIVEGSTSVPYKVADVISGYSRGYSAVNKYAGSVYKQDSNQNIFSMENTVKALGSNTGYGGYTWLFPYDMNSWSMSSNRYGSKPISGTVTPTNNSTLHTRYLATSATSYKTEVYVVITASRNTGIQTIGLPSKIYGVHVAIYTTSDGITQSVELIKDRTFGYNTGTHTTEGIIYYIELSTDLSAMNLSMPILVLNRGSTLIASPRITLTVQTLVTLKGN